jgi:hypothetical protein
MEDLSIEELKQLVTFYKQRLSDVELSMLQTQLKLNKLMSESVSKDVVTEKNTTEKNKN